MSNFQGFSILLSISLNLLLFINLSSGKPSTNTSSSCRLTIVNNCYPMKLWPTSQTLQGSRPAKMGSETGLLPNLRHTIELPRPWKGRIWARTHCTRNNGRLNCQTGNCAKDCEDSNSTELGGLPPFTSVEFELFSSASSGKDSYFISFMEGSNLHVSIEPEGSLSGADCRRVACAHNFNQNCPNQLKVINEADYPIGCNNPCTMTNKTDEFCCNGPTSGSCSRNEFVDMVENLCPLALSSIEDCISDRTTCIGASGYKVTFCPEY